MPDREEHLEPVMMRACTSPYTQFACCVPDVLLEHLDLPLQRSGREGKLGLHQHLLQNLPNGCDLACNCFA